MDQLQKVLQDQIQFFQQSQVQVVEVVVGLLPVVIQVDQEVVEDKIVVLNMQVEQETHHQLVLLKEIMEEVLQQQAQV